MVGIVTGNGAGLAGSSKDVLGANGQLGLGGLGQAGGQIYVNGKTGNLIIQQADEILAGRGLDIGVVRTYNSQGGFDFDNGDSWQLSLYRRVFGLSGTLNTAGSSIQRQGADGAILTYTYDTGSGKYLNKSGSGAYDSLSYNVADNTLTWTDGDSGLTEAYTANPLSAGEWYITSTTDRDGNTLTYGYDSTGLINSISDEAGQTTWLIYDANRRLQQVTQQTAAGTVTRTYYTYDSQGRLSAAMVDLSPEDGSVADGKLYGTAYTYDGTSNRIATITNSDGTQVGITYDAQGRVAQIIDGAGQATTFTYIDADADGNSDSTTVTDALGRVTTLSYDTDGNLTRVQGPGSQDVAYAYDTDGNLLSLTDSLGNVTAYSYDANGNRTRQQDAAGNVIEWSYNSLNQVTTETRYVTPDPDGAGAGQAADPAVTTYSYDSSNRLQYVTTPEGRVTEYRYDSYGQATAVLISQSGTVIQRVDTTYDARGLASSVTRYSAVDGSGVGTGTASTTQYLYDAFGRLIYRVDPRGVATTSVANDYVTAYVYDGLGRQIAVAQYDATGTGTLQSATTYHDAQNKVQVTLANGLTRVSSYDARGLLVSQLETDGSTVLSETAYVYDAFGRLRITTDSNNNSTYLIYDEAGNLAGSIDATGAFTETTYNANGQPTGTTRYANRVTADLEALFSINAEIVVDVSLAQVRPATSVNDRSTSITYDDTGRVIQTTDALGYVTDYAYDGKSQLTDTIRRGQNGDADRHTRSFYSADGLLIGVLDAAGYLIANTYDAAGNRTQTTRYAGQTAAGLRATGSFADLQASITLDAQADQVDQYAYNAQGQLISHTDAAGYVTTYAYDLAGNRTETQRVGQTSSYAYDDQNRLISETRPDGTFIEYAYDSVGNLIQTTTAQGMTDARTVQRQYDLQGRLIKETSASGIEVTHAYDAAGRRISTTAPDGQGGTRTTLFYYDDAGRLTHSINALGEASSYAYDVFGGLVKETRHAARLGGTVLAQLTGGDESALQATLSSYQLSLTSAFDRIVQTSYDKRGQVQSSTDALNQTRTRSYNSFGELQSSIDALGVRTDYAYDLRGQLTQSTQDVGGLNRITSTQYDAFGRVTGSTNGLGKTTAYAYDRLGRQVSVTNALNVTQFTTYDAFSRVLTQTDALGHETSYSYDLLSRSVTITTPEGISTTTVRNAHGETVSVTDGRNVTTTYSYDEDGRLLETVRDSGAGRLNLSTTNTYDDAGQLASFTDAKGMVTEYSYDAVGRILERTVDAGAGKLNLTTRYTYDALGQVLTVIDPRGTVTQTTYDKNGQVTLVAVDPSGLNLQTTYAYDDNGRTLSVTRGFGSPVAQTTQYVYDDLGRRTQEIVDPGTPPTQLNITTSYTYDLADNAVSKTDANGNVTQYAYDDAGRLIETTDALGNVIRTDYDAAGRVTDETRAYGTAAASTTHYVYNDDGRVIAKTTAYGTSSAATTQTEYDAAGNVVKLIDPNGNAGYFWFDAAGRNVLHVDPEGYATSTAYTATGEVAQITRHAAQLNGPFSVSSQPTLITSGQDQITTLVHDAVGRQTQLTDAAGYVETTTYDAVGNKLTFTNKVNGVFSYTYDKAGRVETETLPVTSGGQVVINEFEYDALGNRTKRTEALGLDEQRITTWTYDKLNRVLTQRGESVSVYNPTTGNSSNVTPTETRTYDANGNLILSVNPNGGKTYTYYDANNRKIATLSPVGGLTTYSYDAAGNLLSERRYSDAVALPAQPGGTAPTAGENWRETRYVYDGNGRAIRTEIAGQMRANGVLVTQVMHSEVVFDAGGVPSYIPVLEDALVTERVYDANGNVIQEIDARGNTVYRYYDAMGRKTLEVDALRYVTTWAYDANGNITEEIRHAIALAAGVSLTSKPTPVTNGADRKTTFTYDLMNRALTESVHGVVYDSGSTSAALNTATGIATTTYAYNGLGKVTQKTDGLNNISNWQYDALGRETQRKGAGYADHNGTTVRPTTDTTYNGLGLVSETIQRGTNNSSTADDRKTTYDYGKNGYLISQQSANGVVTTFANDAMGNTVSQSFTRSAGTDTHLFFYDAAGRQVMQQTKRNATVVETRETRYNVLGEITGKRTYADVAPGASTWQETADYDNIGRIWRSNSGDGIYKISVFDANGNATAKITSASVDLRTQASYTDLLAVDGNGTSDLLSKASLMVELSQFDARNKLVRTIQPSMTGDKFAGSLGQVLTQKSGNSVDTGAPTAPISNPTTTTATSSTTVGTPGVVGGNVTATLTVSTGRIGSMAINLPNLDLYGSGNIKVVLTKTFSLNAIGMPATQTQTFTPASTITFSNIGLYMQAPLPPPNPPVLVDRAVVSSFRLTVYKQASSGDIQISESTFAMTGGSWVNTSGTVKTTAAPKRLVISGLSTSTADALLWYRTSGSTGAWSSASMTQLKNSTGAVIAGSYEFDWSSLATGSYEYWYEGSSADGEVLSSGKGTMNLGTTPTVTHAGQTIGNTGGGRAFMHTNGNIYFSQLSSAHTTSATTAQIAAAVTVRYRIAGNTGDWTDSAVTTHSGIAGLFYISTSGLTTDADYEYLIEAKNSSGAVINQSYGTFTAGTANGNTVSALAQTQKFVLSDYPANSVMKLAYRQNGTTGAYTDITLTANASGQFTWDPSEINAGTYEFKYEVFANASAIDPLISNASGTFTVGNAVSSDSFTIANKGGTPTVLTIPVSNPEALQLKLYYRSAGETVYSGPITLSRASADDDFIWDANNIVPPGGIATLEYYVLMADASGNPLLEDPLATVEDQVQLRMDGVFNVGATEADPVIVPWAITNISLDNTISRQQSYNAFGEIISETDGRGYTTEYTYNNLGLLTLKLDPTVNVTAENGVISSLRPETRYTYDLLGRMIATQDANIKIDANGNIIRNVSRQAWLSDDTQRVISQWDALNQDKQLRYDVYGNLVRQADELGDIDALVRVTQYEYDAMGQLTRIVRPSGVDDQYGYDEAGNRISHTNALNQTETTEYDALGRITRTTSYGGVITRYAYVYDDAIGGMGGWQKTTTQADGTADAVEAIEKTNIFGRITWKEDYGNRAFTYTYNSAGWLTRQYRSDATGQDIAYSYYNNGYLREINDVALNTVTSYAYDKDGNRIQEYYKYQVGTAWTSAQVSDVTYDALNRVTKISDPQASISYEYDAVGNRRRVYSYYHDGINGQMATQDYWYTYDKTNRFTITMGKLVGGRGGEIKIETTGVAISYDAAGQRIRATYGEDNHKEAYSYNADGYLTKVDIDYNATDGADNWRDRNTRTLDALGRTLWLEEKDMAGADKTTWMQYDADSNLTQQREWDNKVKSQIDANGNNAPDSGAPAATRTTVNTYFTTGLLKKSSTDEGATTVDTTYQYEWWDEAKQKNILANPDNPDATKWKNGYSKFSYDVNGHLDRVDDPSQGETGKGRSIRFVTNAEGMILERSEFAGGTANSQGVVNSASIAMTHRYYYHDGKRVGEVGNDGTMLMASTQSYAEQLAQPAAKTGRDKYRNWKPIASADFDQNYQPINRGYPGATASQYTVKGGETLQSIAASVWGDSSMWYLIADANGLRNGEVLKAGQVLTIPNKVTNIHNNSQTFKPYNAGEAIGDTSPTLPEPPPPPRPSSGDDGGCGGIGSIFVAIVTIVVAIYAPYLMPTIITNMGPMAVAAASAAVANVAGQVTANVVGIQDGFNWGSVALSAVSAGVTQGLIGGTPLANGEQTHGMFGQSIANNFDKFGQVVMRATVQNAVGQGLGVAAGMQDKFSWTGVAASGIGAAAGYGMGLALKGTEWGNNAILNGTSMGLANGAAQAFTFGQKPNWTEIAMNSFGEAAGESLGLVMAGQTGNAYSDTVVKRQDIGASWADDVTQKKSELMFYHGLEKGSMLSIAPETSIGRLSVVGADGTPGLTATDADRQIYFVAKQTIESLKLSPIVDLGNQNQYVIYVWNDGTQNSRDVMSLDTNPAEMERLSANAPGFGRRATIYTSGVGTEFDPLWLNSATGVGAIKQLDEAYQEVVLAVGRVRESNPNAEFVFVTGGFSRGAAVTRALNNVLVDRGIPDLNSRTTSIDGEVSYTRNVVEPGAVNIGATLLYDTVSTGATTLMKLSIPAQVQNVLHLAARDETRGVFPLTSIYEERTSAGNAHRLELILPGAHTNIGGGTYDERGLGHMNLQLGYTYLQKLGIPLAPIPSSMTPDPERFAIHDSRFIKAGAFHELLDQGVTRQVIYGHR